MDLRNLELFLHLADSLHFGKSADAMAVSPSTLSRAIQRLEQETGCVLFERDNRSVRLTPAGGKLREFGGRLLQELGGRAPGRGPLGLGNPGRGPGAGAGFAGHHQFRT